MILCREPLWQQHTCTGMPCETGKAQVPSKVVLSSNLVVQYNSTPGNHGSVKFFYARLLDIFMGTVITSLFAFVLPW